MSDEATLRKLVRVLLKAATLAKKLAIDMEADKPGHDPNSLESQVLRAVEKAEKECGEKL